VNVNRRELVELLLVLALTMVILSYPDLSVETMVLYSFVSSVGVLLHEFAHKYVASRLGKVDVRIRAYYLGMILGLLTAVRSGGEFVLMLPAYTAWEEPTSPFEVLFDESSDEVKERRFVEELRKDALIALAGVAVNGLIALASFLALMIIRSFYGGFYNFLIEAARGGSVLQFFLPLILLNVSWFNGMLSFINLIPLPLPLPLPSPSFASTDGLLFAGSAVELIRRGRYENIPWKMFVLSLIGALIYILLEFFGIISAEIFYAYDKVLKIS